MHEHMFVSKIKTYACLKDKTMHELKLVSKTYACFKKEAMADLRMQIESNEIPMLYGPTWRRDQGAPSQCVGATEHHEPVEDWWAHC